MPQKLRRAWPMFVSEPPRGLSETCRKHRICRKPIGNIAMRVSDTCPRISAAFEHHVGNIGNLTAQLSLERPEIEFRGFRSRSSRQVSDVSDRHSKNGRNPRVTVGNPLA